MKRFIRTLSLIVSLSILITVLGACTPKTTPSGSTSGTSQPKDIETVNLFNSVGAYLAVLEKLVKEYNEGEGLTDGVKIEMTTNIDNYTEVLEAAVKAGNAPDMYTCNSNHKDKYMGTPTLVLEILSDSTRSKDMVNKLHTYLVSGVSEYWIVDPKSKSILIYEFADHSIDRFTQYKEGEVALSGKFEGLSINVSELFTEWL